MIVGVNNPKKMFLTFLSGLAISGKIPQNGLITSKNLTEITKNPSLSRLSHLISQFFHSHIFHANQLEKSTFINYT